MSFDLKEPGNILQLLSILALWATVIVMAWQIREMRTAREGESRPTITMSLKGEIPDVENTIVVKNVGPGIAREIFITFAFTGPTSIPLVKHGPFNLGVRDRQEFAAGYFPNLLGEYFATVTAEYKDVYGRIFKDAKLKFKLLVGVRADY